MASELEGLAGLHTEDAPPPEPLTYRDLIAMQRRLEGNRSLLSLRSNNGRMNCLRLALAVLAAALWGFAVNTHGLESWHEIGWIIMLVVATGNLVASLLIGLRVVALGEQILRIGAGDLEYRARLAGRDEMVRMSEALETLRARSARVVKLQLIERMTVRLEERNATLRDAICDLRKTQDALVARQKAVELGDLTAGLAHEMRNPLNFVKNFGEGTRDLTAELAQALEDRSDRIGAKGREALRDLLRQVEGNLGSIEAHTARAETIVAQMTMLGAAQGEAQELGLNAFIGQHARLACRAAEQRDPGHMVTLNEAYDERIGQIRVVPQALGRALLNLVNNASEAARHPAGDDAPTVWVETRRKGDEIEIEVRDNGPGIDVAIREEVLTPFFTTKSSDTASGLGLGQCADAARQHGGRIVIGSAPEGGASVMLTIARAGLGPSPSGHEPSAAAAGD